MIEHRHTHRVFFDCFVDFEADNAKHVCELYDISLEGALIGACSGATPPPGSSCKLSITLGDADKPDIVMNGRVAHKIENRVGIHCESIDIDSMTHLRKLVELNLGNSDLVNRDLDGLVRDHLSRS